MKWFTSRYTAALETQVSELKAELDREREETKRLNGLLLQGQPKPVPESTVVKRPPSPQVGNWLNVRSQLERPDQQVSEIIVKEN